MSALAIQLLSVLASAVISGVSVHLWHTSGTPATASTPAAPGAPLFPSHPIASKALTDILTAAEQAALAAAKQVFNAQAPALSPPVSPATPASH